MKNSKTVTLWIRNPIVALKKLTVSMIVLRQYDKIQTNSILNNYSYWKA